MVGRMTSPVSYTHLKNMTLKNSCFKPLPKAYVEYVSDISRRGFDIIQVEFYPCLLYTSYLPSVFR